MTDFVMPPEDLTITVKEEGSLGLYEFGTKAAHHFYCKSCGIYPFHQTARFLDQYRVNLGCVDDIDELSLEMNLFDGKGLL